MGKVIYAEEFPKRIVYGPFSAEYEGLMEKFEPLGIEASSADNLIRSVYEKSISNVMIGSMDPWISGIFIESIYDGVEVRIFYRGKERPEICRVVEK